MGWASGSAVFKVGREVALVSRGLRSFLYLVTTCVVVLVEFLVRLEKGGVKRLWLSSYDVYMNRNCPVDGL